MSLDHTSYPHLFEKIVAYLDWETLRLIRLTSSAVNDKACAIIYRHVILEIYDNDLVIVRDPYCYRPMLRLDTTIPESPELRPSTQRHNLSVNEAIARLLKHTRIIEFSTTRRFYHPYHWDKTLEGLIAQAEAVRHIHCNMWEVNSSPCSASHRPSCIRSIDRGTWTGWLWQFTRGTNQPSDELVIVIPDNYPSHVKSYPFVANPPASRLSWIKTDCHIYTGELGRAGSVITKVVFIKVKGSRTPPSSSDTEWNDYVGLFEEMSPMMRALMETQPHPVTFSHITAAEYQRTRGLSNLQLHLLTTVPEYKFSLSMMEDRARYDQFRRKPDRT
ncbi:uncharacterized protein LOC62_07G008950 [Vanrija pseudolonga]|uniref:Uncharacterized protein n=1 Tax=Vanrija pseudolonga TaxID=143232 RepID=A0AAF1BL54_9TREE|nr:hypothetical protein LOC62_07G008950 [Vanrija pseudolonga]